jgi:hypothetical protein
MLQPGLERVRRVAAQVNPSKYYFEPCKGAPHMSQSLVNIIVHLVFSPKGRRQLLRDEERGRLHAYITAVLKNPDSRLIEID